MVEMIIIHIWQIKHTNIYQEIIFNDKHLQIFTFNLILHYFTASRKALSSCCVQQVAVPQQNVLLRFDNFHCIDFLALDNNINIKGIQI